VQDQAKSRYVLAFLVVLSATLANLDGSSLISPFKEYSRKAASQRLLLAKQTFYNKFKEDLLEYGIDVCMEGLKETDGSCLNMYQTCSYSFVGLNGYYMNEQNAICIAKSILKGDISFENYAITITHELVHAIQDCADEGRIYDYNSHNQFSSVEIKPLLIAARINNPIWTRESTKKYYMDYAVESIDKGPASENPMENEAFGLSNRYNLVKDRILPSLCTKIDWN